jgi:hypothetical protein
VSSHDRVSDRDRDRDRGHVNVRARHVDVYS